MSKRLKKLGYCQTLSQIGWGRMEPGSRRSILAKMPGDVYQTNVKADDGSYYVVFDNYRNSYIHADLLKIEAEKEEKEVLFVEEELRKLFREMACWVITDKKQKYCKDKKIVQVLTEDRFIEVMNRIKGI